jgi:hypothetical protein
MIARKWVRADQRTRLLNKTYLSTILAVCRRNPKGKVYAVVFPTRQNSTELPQESILQQRCAVDEDGRCGKTIA